jgi:NarL family two-component system sensor histidine kinase LiaS
MRHTIPMRWYQQLRWRLSLLYIAVTVGLIFMGLWITQVMSYFNYRSIAHPEKLVRLITDEAQELGPYISAYRVNDAALTLYLKQESERLREGSGRWPGLSFYSSPSVYAEITNQHGVPVASFPSNNQAPGELSAGPFQVSQAALISSALRGEGDSRRSLIENDTMAAAAPIFDGKHEIVGALFMRVRAPFDWRVNWLRVAKGLAKPLIMLIALAFVGGIGFGLVTARHLVNRLQRISTAAEAWGHGDFTALADDGRADEVGQLSRQLNAMAEELRGFLTLRQELATLEERNRLARDLHDTVKQRIFALAMQIGAAQSMLNGGMPEVSQRLNEAEKLAHEVQQELVAIIKELLPQHQAGKEFEQLLREHVANWARQSGVTAEVINESKLDLPAPVEQAFFRILQEALANVLRHSRASHAVVDVSQFAKTKVTLSVTDDGEGFDPDAVNGGIGLRNMRERAEALPGGWLKVETRKGKGVRVTAGCAVGAVEAAAVAAAKDQR